MRAKEKIGPRWMFATIALAIATPRAASADVVHSHPITCAMGSVPQATHHGMVCAVMDCTTDDDCSYAKLVCGRVPLCVLRVHRGNHPLSREPSDSAYAKGNCLAGTACPENYTCETTSSFCVPSWARPNPPPTPSAAVPDAPVSAAPYAPSTLLDPVFPFPLGPLPPDPPSASGASSTPPLDGSNTRAVTSATASGTALRPDLAPAPRPPGTCGCSVVGSFAGSTALAVGFAASVLLLARRRTRR